METSSIPLEDFNKDCLPGIMKNHDRILDSLPAETQFLPTLNTLLQHQPVFSKSSYNIYISCAGSVESSFLNATWGEKGNIVQ